MNGNARCISIKCRLNIIEFACLMFGVCATKLKCFCWSFIEGVCITKSSGMDIPFLPLRRKTQNDSQHFPAFFKGALSMAILKKSFLFLVCER